MAAPDHRGNPPNETLYVQNLNEKTNNDTMKKSLMEVCSAFGNIEDIICMKSLKRRGQAWIIFSEVEGAGKALKALQKFKIYGKEMVIHYAKTKSDVIAKKNGTYVPRPKRVIKSDPTQKNKKNELEMPDGQQQQQMGQQSSTSFGRIPVNNPLLAGVDQSQGQGGFGGFGGAPANVPPVQQYEELPPNKTLFVQDLPDQANDQFLTMLFRQNQGFKEVRSIPGRKCAFVDYDSVDRATIALRMVSNLDFGAGRRLNVNYARR